MMITKVPDDDSAPQSSSQQRLNTPALWVDSHFTEDFTDSSYAVKFSRGCIRETTAPFSDGLFVVIDITSLKLRFKLQNSYLVSMSIENILLTNS